MISQSGSRTKNIKASITSKGKIFAGKFVLVFILLFAIVAGLVIYEQVTKSRIKTVTINKQMLIRRSRDPGVIYRGLTGKAIDVNTEKIVTAARIFSINDFKVYLELDLQTPPIGTLVDYIRYKEGRYVDNGEITIARTDVKNVLFNWTINKLLAGATNGNWKIATYTNGILAKRILYQITNNKVSYVYPQKNVLPTDPDYHLTNTLTQGIVKGY